MKFKKQTMKARDLGRLFGESSHTINQWLEQADLLDEKSKLPTFFARQNGYCKQVMVAGYNHEDWLPEKTVPRLVERGHQLVIDLPDDFVQPIELIGPFRCRGQTILNSDGDPVAFLNNPNNAEFTCRLLNAAHKSGTIDRLLLKKSKSITTINESD
jgi:hypothetical protein